MWVEVHQPDVAPEVAEHRGQSNRAWRFVPQTGFTLNTGQFFKGAHRDEVAVRTLTMGLLANQGIAGQSAKDRSRVRFKVYGRRWK